MADNSNAGFQGALIIGHEIISPAQDARTFADG